MRLRLVAVSLLIGCSQGGPEQYGTSSAAQGSYPPLTTEAVSAVDVQEVCSSCDDMADVVVISEERFLAALPSSAASEPKLRRFGAELNAVANAPTTLGIIGEPVEQSHTGSIFVVARDFNVANGYVQTRDFYIAIVNLALEAELGIAPRFALSTSSFEPASCLENSKSRGCRPLTTTNTGIDSTHTWAAGDKGAAVPPEVVLNAETPPAVANGSGLRLELRLYWSEEANVVNRFACHGVIGLGACGTLGPHESPYVEGSAYLLSLDSQGGVALVSESDLPMILAGSVGPSPEWAEDAVRYATAANLPEAVGVLADVAEASEFAVHTLIVARDLVRTGQYLQATQFYVVPWRARGNPSLFGTNVKMGFKIPMTRLPTLKGPCGLLSSFKGYGYCGPLECPPVSVYANPRFGEERWLTEEPRTTLRIPGSESPLTRQTIYVCNEFQPPPPQDSLCRNQSETCNGEDDNCNGAVDEGAVCEAGCVP